TEQRCLRRVIGERDVAADTARHEAALATDDARRRATPVQEEDRLLLAPQRLGQRHLQRLAQDAGVAGAQLGAPINQRDVRQLRDVRLWTGAGDGDALAQLDQPVRSLARAPEGFRRGGGAAQDDCRAGERSKLGGDIARVIRRRALLLVRRLVLLV